VSTDRYIALVPSANSDKTKFIAWLNATLGPLDSIYELLKTMYTYFDIDVAVGNQLDIIGEWVGVSRTLNFQPVSGPAIMTDAVYRNVIKVKISSNAWDGTNETYVPLWNLALPGIPIIYTDNQDMSISIVTLTLPDPYTTELIQNGYYAIKPQAINLNFAAVPLLFAYDAASLSPTEYGGYDNGYYL